MKFSAHPAKQQNQGYFFSQPHQPFFLFGVIWAIVSMMIFLLSHKGIILLSIAENQFHLYSLAFIVFIQFFHGFLFTTFPRFCTSMNIPKEVYVRIVWLYQIGATAFFIGSLVWVWLAWISMFMVLFAHAMALFTLRWIYMMGQSPLKQDPYWLLIAHGIGFGAHIFWIVAFGAELMGYASEWFSLVSPVIVNFLLIFLTFTVAQRMIPFFSHSLESRPSHFVAAVFVLFVLKTLSAMASLPMAEAVISIVLALYLLSEFIRWKLPLFRSPAIVWVLHLALFWLPSALLLGALAQIAEFFTHQSFLFLGTHLLVLGFLTTALIGFGTRVTLGHSGQTPHADTLSIILFWWTQIVLLARLALSIDTSNGAMHPWIFDLTVTLWIILFCVWGYRYGKILIFGKPNK